MKISKVVKECDKVTGRNAAIGIAMKLLGLDGGEGSGNFGHAGRPGQVGGSASEEGSAGSEGSSSKSEEIEKIKAEIPKLSRFGEQGKKRAELQKKLEELEGENRKEAPTKHAGIPAKNPAVGRIEPKNYPVTEHKQSQFEIIQKTNPMHDDIHTGIRSPSDIMSPEEALSQGDDNSFVYPDWSREDGKKALETGMVTLYSSYPIKNGVFVTPSKRMSTDYSGGKEPYSVTVPVSDVAWINSDEGQFARVTENKSKDDCFDKSFRFSDVIREFGRDRDKKETIRLAMRMLGLDTDALDGGPGSGNWGHLGRPGKRGGSGKGGGKAYRGGSAESGFTNTRKDWTAALSKEDSDVLRVLKKTFSNPEHESWQKEFMDNGNLSVRKWLVNKFGEARNWKSDYAKRDLAEEHLDKKEMKILRQIWSRYGISDDGYSESMPEDAFEYYLDLKSKALGGPTRGVEMPESLKEELEGKKRTPKVQETKFPKIEEWYDKPRDWNASSIEMYMELAIGEPTSYGHKYTKEEFTEINQRFLDKLKYGSIGIKEAKYALSAMTRLRNAMYPGYEFNFSGGYSYTPESFSNLTQDEKNRLVEIADKYSKFETIRSIDDLNAESLRSIESDMRSKYTNLRKKEDRKDVQDYILLQEKIFGGFEPSPSSVIEKEKETERKEEEKKDQERKEKAQAKVDAIKKDEVAFSIKNLIPSLKKDIESADSPEKVNSLMKISELYSSEAKTGFDKMDVKTAKESSRAVVDMIERYPVMKGYMSQMTVGGLSYGTNGSCRTLLPGSPIVISSYDVSHMDEAVKDLKEAVESKHHPANLENVNPIVVTVVHEMGHALDGRMCELIGYDNNSPKIGRASKDNLYSADVRKRALKELGIKQTKDAVKENLSNYANTNAREFFAEAMCEAMLSPNPRPIALKVREIVDNDLKGMGLDFDSFVSYNA